MAKAKKTTKKSAAKSESNVVRIRASSSPVPKTGTVSEKVKKASAPIKKKPSKEAKKTKYRLPGAPLPLRATGGYFKGAWIELRQVRWPNRRATWGLTGAVLLYSAFFVVLVLLLDAGFKYLFELILGK